LLQIQVSHLDTGSLDIGVYRRRLETLATIGLKAHRREC
jgi:hypothetical protein